LKTLPNLTINLGKLKLKNPVLVASGTFGYGEEYAELINLDKLGGNNNQGGDLKAQKGKSSSSFGRNPFRPPQRHWTLGPGGRGIYQGKDALFAQV